MMTVSDREKRISNAAATVKEFVERARKMADHLFPDVVDDEKSGVIAQLAVAMTATYSAELTSQAISDIAAAITDARPKD